MLSRRSLSLYVSPSNLDARVPLLRLSGFVCWVSMCKRVSMFPSLALRLDTGAPLFPPPLLLHYSSSRSSSTRLACESEPLTVECLLVRSTARVHVLHTLCMCACLRVFAFACQQRLPRLQSEAVSACVCVSVSAAVAAAVCAFAAAKPHHQGKRWEGVNAV